MPTDRISSLDPGYQTGELSVFDAAIDTPYILYTAVNNGESTLSQSLSYLATYMLVDNTSVFAPNGIISIDQELIYYDSKGVGILNNLIRGFLGSRQPHTVGTSVQASVMAEYHNAIKDAVLNIEATMGTSVNPSPISFNGILSTLESIILSPSPSFRAFPLSGRSPLVTSFHNFSNNNVLRFLWDFGDGGVSTERNPTHTYLSDGMYTVSLSVITVSGGQGNISKSNYITVQSEKQPGFFYCVPEMGTTSSVFTMVDQTEGAIIARYWVFGDGQTASVTDPNMHTITHTYLSTGEYNPTLLVEFSDQSLEQVSLSNSIVVTG